MPRRFVSVIVSRLRSHTLHLQVREASWLSLKRSFAVDHKTREPQENRRDGYLFRATPLSSVSSSSVSSLARASCAYTLTSFLWCHRRCGEWWRKRGLLQFFILLFFSHVWRCGVGLERAFAGRRRAMARGVLRVGQREFFSWAEKKCSLGREQIFPFGRGKFPTRAGDASCLKTDGPLGAAAVAETGAEGVACSYL